MYYYVTDKVFLKESYSLCADLVNQLVQHLKKYDIEASMSVVGSKRRGLVTQNGKGPIDYDFNLCIEDCANINNAKTIKQTVIKAFNEVLKDNDWRDCQDSTSVITTKQKVLRKGNKTPFRIDICIIYMDQYGHLNRLRRRKTGNVRTDQYYWNQGPRVDDIEQKEKYLKPDYWQDVRDAYLKKKNMYLSRQDTDHPSFVCYYEAVNEVYDRVRYY